MPKQEQIRSARLDDADSVWPLARDFATSFTPERTAFDSTWGRLVGAPETLLLVAEAGEGDIVGYLLGSRHLTFLANGPVAWVEEVMVEQSSRRAGPFLHRTRLHRLRRLLQKDVDLRIAPDRGPKFMQVVGPDHLTKPKVPGHDRHTTHRIR